MFGAHKIPRRYGRLSSVAPNQFGLAARQRNMYENSQLPLCEKKRKQYIYVAQKHYTHTHVLRLYTHLLRTMMLVKGRHDVVARNLYCSERDP